MEHGSCTGQAVGAIHGRARRHLAHVLMLLQHHRKCYCELQCAMSDYWEATKAEVHCV